MNPRRRVLSSLSIVLLFAGCSSPAADRPVQERLAADTPKTTVEGNAFIAPAGWSVAVRGPATILEASRAATPSAKLAAHYKNAALGDIGVLRKGPSTICNFREFKSEVASRHNPDGTVSFITIVPGLSGFELVVGAAAKKTLIARDAQHEYVFDAQ